MTTTDTPQPQAEQPQPGKQSAPGRPGRRLLVAGAAAVIFIAGVGVGVGTASVNDNSTELADTNTRVRELNLEISELEDEIVGLRDENDSLTADNAELQARVDDLIVESDLGVGQEPETDADTSLDVGEASTREAPFALGDVTTAGDDWEFSVTKVTLDAWDEIRAENEFNDPPASGEQFVMFKIKATYTGDDVGLAWTAFNASIVGSDGNTFTEYENGAGVIPDALSDTNDVYPGAKVSGNVAIAVPSDQLGGAVIRLDVDDDNYETYRGFFALK